MEVYPKELAMLKDFFKLAARNLKRRGVRSWLTLLGIFIGVAAVVSLITLGQGLRAAVNSQFGVSSTEIITIQAGGISLGPPGSGAVNPIKKSDVEAIRNLDSIELAVGRIIPTVKIEYNDELEIGYAASVPDGDERKFIYEQTDIEIESGRFLEDGDGKKVMLGINFYTGKAGFDRAVKPGQTIQIEGEDFDVSGITKTKGSFLLDNAIWVNEAVLEELIGNGEDVDIIVAKVKNKDLMDKAKEDIEKLMRQRRDVKKGEEDFNVETPESALATVNQILGGIQAFILVIASVSIIVGAIGIINTMTTSVLERRKEIGIMKAVGARNSDIFIQFMIESGLMGFLGGFAGVLIGIIIGVLGSLAINNYIGAATTPQINFVLVTGALLASFAIGSISGIVPAMKAARQNPVEVLRD